MIAKYLASLAVAVILMTFLASFAAVRDPFLRAGRQDGGRDFGV